MWPSVAVNRSHLLNRRCGIDSIGTMRFVCVCYWKTIFILQTYCGDLLSEENGTHKAFSHMEPLYKSTW